MIIEEIEPRHISTHEKIENFISTEFITILSKLKIYYAENGMYDKRRIVYLLLLFIISFTTVSVIWFAALLYIIKNLI